MGYFQKLERRIETLERKTKERERIEEELLEAAKQWARLNKLGYFLDEKGERVLIHDKELEEVYMMKIRQISTALLRVETS